MKKRSTQTLVLALAALFLFSVSAPLVAHAQDAAATTTVVKKKVVKKAATHKTTVAHKAVKKKTATTTTKKKIASKTTVKKTVAHSTVRKATPVVLSAPALADVNPPTMTTTAAAHPRSMAEMAKPPGRSSGAEPRQVVQHFYDDLLGAMKQADSLGFDGRSQKMQALLDQSFNVNDMMRTAAGPSWGTASSTQQQQLVQSFRTFTAATYASRFSRYGGEQFNIIDEKPGLSANEKIVETQLVEDSGSKTDLNYLLRRDGAGKWKIVDVYVDGTISEMAARRSEFGSVLRRDGVDALLKLMDEKSRQLASS